MTINWEQLAAIFEVFGSVCGVLGLVAALWLKSTFVTRASYNVTVETLLKRILDAERLASAAATSKEITTVNLGIANLEGTLKAIQERVSGLSLAFDRQADAVNRVESFMMGKHIS